MPRTAHKIPDPNLEGAVRKLVVLAELRAATFYAFDPGDVALLRGLRQTADELRGMLDGKTIGVGHDD